jgi:protein-disulfide isomerase
MPMQNRTTMILFVVILILAFAVGAMWQKINALQGGGGRSATQTPTATTQPERLSGGKISADKAKLIPEVSDGEHIRGATDPEIYLIEYSDFECPYCKRFHPTAQQALEEYGDKMAWVYRQFPLVQLHKQAPQEAQASECVADLGGNDAFWKFADLIYEETPSNDGLDLDKLPDYAAQAGVDKSAFEDCLDSGKFEDKVNQQEQGGIKAGVNGTPGSFIVNKKGEAWFVPGALPYENLKQMIDEALASN